jgi:hypothetical protein
MTKLEFPCMRWIVPRLTPVKKTRKADKNHPVYNSYVPKEHLADRYVRCNGNLSLELRIVDFYPEVELLYLCDVCGEYSAYPGKAATEDELETLAAEALNRRNKEKKCH